ncbi:uncharacterized protein [Montipora foliosa]|uniref:uncharacterized protein n=1 Tax=Montipora foliosa TaxID=591990 RepID=UPI0035F15270
MDKLRVHYTGSTGSSLLTDRYKFWTSSQGLHESIQEWEVKVRHAGSLCGYGDLSDELCRDKFIFGLSEDNIRTELLKIHIKPDNSEKSLSDVVAEARAIESAKQTNKLIADSSKGIDEHVHWTGLRHSQMKLRREPGTCFWCGDRRGPDPWKLCPANGKTCTSCGGNDHFARVCLEDRKLPSPSIRPTWRPQGRGLQRSQKRDPRTNFRPRDLYYTEMYATAEDHASSYDQDHDYIYSLGTQVHSIASVEKSKRYFTNLSLSQDLLRQIKSASVEQRPLVTGTYAYAKPPPHQRGKPWIYGEVLTHENPRSYTIRTAQGRTIRRNRVHLKPAAAPSCYHPRAAVEASTPHTSASQKLSLDTAEETQPCPRPSAHPQPTPFGTPLLQILVNSTIKGSAPVDPQVPDAPPPETPPEITPPQPQELPGSPVKQTRSGQIINPPKD